MRSPGRALNRAELMKRNGLEGSPVSPFEVLEQSTDHVAACAEKPASMMTMATNKRRGGAWRDRMARDSNTAPGPPPAARHIGYIESSHARSPIGEAVEPRTAARIRPIEQFGKLSRKRRRARHPAGRRRVCVPRPARRPPAAGSDVRVRPLAREQRPGGHGFPAPLPGS